MVLSEKQEALVKESWELMKHDVPRHSFRLFTLIMEKAPRAKDLFSFLRDTDEIPENNPQLRAHAAKIFKLTCESVVQLREKGEVAVGDTTLKWLGSVHLQKGVLEPHFEVVKEALLKTIQEAAGEKWSEEMKNAWGEGYDHLAAAIVREMQVQAAASSKPIA
ncbi:non-symbiotic hemoglobin 2-like [Coffea eugenioides]|uniref:Anaerobic nitrite reductase HB2 n=1 Tax=Coffea arabica TaxID=13443 RepID=A0A6P6W2L3_COFAR|nr:non-symbiotic hemoglobin 2-like [Coffea arabica]XP_027161292.1 non-symbiotic hemoglobin 2-like [Coffea eugenioides]XP_027161316.1 non-symbiotic hemoglobin 2-like [Coffea eugenioides]